MSKVEVPENIVCVKSHEYLIIEGNIATIGITSYAAEQLGEIVYVELPEINSKFTKGDSFGTVESVKAASELYMPISGEVIEVNEKLTSSPELINEDCYGEGWIAKIKDFDQSELDEPMNMEDYLSYIED